MDIGVILFQAFSTFKPLVTFPSGRAELPSGPSGLHANVTSVWDLCRGRPQPPLQDVRRTSICMKIYTRTGDSGQTSLFSGERVEKDDLRVEAYGTLDELNSTLGIADCWCRDKRVKDCLSVIQNSLFDAGADLATSLDSKRRPNRIRKEDWERLEHFIDEFETGVPPLKNFILPNGSPGSTQLHFARAVCRRGERLVVRLSGREAVNPELCIFVNRLSDLLFVLARFENHRSGEPEVVWRPR